MKEYATKLTLYDFISMLMPGSIIVAVLMLLCTEDKLTLPNNAFFWVFFFISSYLAGIVNHIITIQVLPLPQTTKNLRSCMGGLPLPEQDQ